MIKIAGLGLAALALAGCASKSTSIEATEVSSAKYDAYECSQLDHEYTRVLERSNSVNKEQDRIASNDAVATGVGVILFLPALFFIDTDDRREEVARLKGELDAIEQSSIQKDCSDLSARIRTDRTAAEKATAERRKSENDLLDQ